MIYKEKCLGEEVNVNDMVLPPLWPSEPDGVDAVPQMWVCSWLQSPGDAVWHKESQIAIGG